MKKVRIERCGPFVRSNAAIRFSRAALTFSNLATYNDLAGNSQPAASLSKSLYYRRWHCGSGAPMRRRFVVLVTALVSALATTADGAQTAASRFCLLAVERPNDDPARAHGLPLGNRTFQIPGLRGLVFEARLGPGAWFIGADRRLVSYTAPFPRTYLDTWVVESWSSRVVAAPWGRGLAAMKPGSGRFETIVEPSLGLNWRVYALPRSKTTVAVSGKDGTASIVHDDNSLTPWLPDEVLKQIGGVYSIHDSVLLDATIIVARKQQRNSYTGGDLYVLNLDRTLRRIGSLGEDYGELYDVPAADAAVFIAQRDIYTIRKADDTLAVHELLRTSRPPARVAIHFAKQFGQILSFRTQNGFSNDRVWQRLGANGFEAIPGANPGIARPDLFSNGRTHDLALLGYTLIEGADAFYAYDGTSIRRIGGSDRAIVGELPRIFALTAIGRVLATTQNGLFELTRDGKLVPRTLPAALDPERPTLVDWPQAGVALLSTKDGIVALDGDLNATPVSGGESVRLDWFASHGIIEATGEPLMTDRHNLFVASDRDGAGRHACPPAQL